MKGRPNKDGRPLFVIRNSLFVLFRVRLGGFFLVAPRVRLRPRHDIGDIGVNAGRAGTGFGTALLRFFAAHGLLLLFFRSRAFALALASSEWCSHSVPTYQRGSRRPPPPPPPMFVDTVSERDETLLDELEELVRARRAELNSRIK